MSETATSPTVPDRRADAAIAGGLLVLCLVRVIPYLAAGPGFFLDDWRNLARLDTVGWMRAAEASKFASRPGAWAVETVLYTVLRDHAAWWVLTLAVLSAATATALFVTLRRFVPRWNALAVVVVWVLLPNHTSLRVFANTTPMTVGLLLLVIGVWCMDEDRLVLGALLASAGGLCYEVMLLPALSAVVAVHLLRHRGTRRQAVRAGAIVVVTGCLMAIHPTYNPGTARRGTPLVLAPAHFGSGLTENRWLGWLLAATAAMGIAVALVRFVRGERGAHEAPWLVVAGLGVMTVGLAAFALKWPTGVRGPADRNFVVSSVGSAMVWVGCARVLCRRSRAALAVAVGAFALIVVPTNVTYQRQWAESARSTRSMIEAVDCRYAGQPPADLGVGPYVPLPGGVRAIHQFFLADATRVVAGHPMRFVVTEDDEQWEERPADRRVTWDDLLAAGCPP
ncbi:MAG: hypothetical protein JWO77_2615 [Ilumatobacteraceae bacterium]|nr:hypothetical protein [Ilumatobacteraceae bacterium]